MDFSDLCAWFDGRFKLIFAKDANHTTVALVPEAWNDFDMAIGGREHHELFHSCSGDRRACHYWDPRGLTLFNLDRVAFINQGSASRIVIRITRGDRRLMARTDLLPGGCTNCVAVVFIV